jgi:molybdenum cofactor synthesis domain-containing protein
LYRAGILTVSDRGARGEREDISGKVIAEMLAAASMEVAAYDLVPDEEDLIAAKIVEFVDSRKLDLVITTGGTGVSPRDVTPDATRRVMDREIPGMAEAMRQESARQTPHAMLSRAVAAIRKQSLIINLPGSPKGAGENLRAILPALGHALEKIKGSDRECAS